MTKSDYVVFITRAQPFHNGHNFTIQEAAKLASKKVIVLIGSAFGPRDPIDNPLLYEERKRIIEEEYPVLTASKKLAILPLHDYKYSNPRWIEQVQSTVDGIIEKDGWTDYPSSVSLIGLDKDSSTDYLNWFPQWNRIETVPVDEHLGVDATAIRRILFSGHNINFVRGVVPDSTWNFINENMNEDWFKKMCDWYKHVVDYKSQWDVAPYPPTFVTTDAIVVQDGHVLLIERAAQPGKGLLALPGGFLNTNEYIEDGAIRELVEETKIKVPEQVLRGSIVAREVFDHPKRSSRGRTITHAFLINLKSGKGLPKIKASDDAANALWVPFSDIKESELFEDHFHIIQNMLGKI